MSLYRFLLILTLVVSFIYHGHGLTRVPPSLFSDEVDAGYQAYIFNHCGSDYHGHQFPIHFQSFADWRTPLYIHSIALIQRFTGPTDLSVRLPSLIFAFLVIIFFSLIIFYIFKNRWLSLLSIFILSFNPWLYHYGRVGFEASGMLLCLILGLYFWFKYLPSSRFSQLLWALFFSILSVYFYSTAKLFLLLIFSAVIFLWFPVIKRISPRHLFWGLIFSLLLSLPLISDTLRGRSGYRFSYISIFTDPTASTTVDYQRYQDLPYGDSTTIGSQPNFVSKFHHNKLSFVIDKFLINYVSSFSTDFHLLSGDSNLRQGFGQQGNFYYLDALFFLLGLASIFFYPKLRRTILFFLFWLLLAPVPFALTRDSISPHSTRLILMLPPIFFFIILGLSNLPRLLPSKLLWLPLALAYLLGIINFNHFYYYHYSALSVRSWHFGLKQVILDTANIAPKYDRLYYSNQGESLLPFFYFHTRYLPQDGSCHPVSSSPNISDQYFSGRVVEDKYYFGFVEWPHLFAHQPDLDRYLYIVPQLEFLRLQETLSQNSKYQQSIISYKIVSSLPKIYPDQESYYYLTFEKKPI